MTRTINVAMFDDFTLCEEGVTDVVHADLGGRSRRLWLLIAYLVFNKTRGVPPQELIDLLWPEANSADPVSTLQNNVSRARSMLSKAGFENPRELIKYEGGLYRWAPDCITHTDYDEFERMAHECGDDADLPASIGAMEPEGKDETTQEARSRLECALKACELYKGDFLAQASGEAWCINPNIYYRSLFTRLCHGVVRDLVQAGRIEEAEQLCLRAIDIDPTVEEFSIVLMHLLTYCGNPQKALDHYDRIKKLFEQEYGVQVSAELDLERASAMQMLYGTEMGEQAIRDFLNSSADEKGAFYCSNSVFREIVHLHLREVRRSGSTAQIVAMNLAGKNDDRERLSTDMRRLEHTLSGTLRSGDPFTKVGSSQFLVLLPTATRENAEMVMQRVSNRFSEQYPQVKASISVSFFDIGNFA